MMATTIAGGVPDELLWSATEYRCAQANLTEYRHLLEREWGVSLPDYEALHDFSICHVESFWKSFWTYAGIAGEWDGKVVLKRGASLVDDRWFPEARINFAENLLRRCDFAEALVYRDETGFRRSITFKELHQAVARVQAALSEAGIGRGDRVVGYLPNLPETVIAMLATTAIGAIWSVVSQDLSPVAAKERIGQLDAAVLITADGTRYAGRKFPLLENARTLAASMPSLRLTIVIPNLESTPNIHGLPAARLWADVTDGRSESVPVFARLPFSEPAFAVFTSGTTGKPKCILHCGGGLLLQFAKEQLLHADIKANDRIFRFTTTGWMMWNWSVAALALGATVVLYEGAPLYPKIDALFDLAESERLTFFSPSAALLDAYAKAAISPKNTHDLGSVRTMYSSGMRVSEANFRFVYTNIKEDLFFTTPCGGTDPMAAFLAGDPTGVIRAGEIPVQALGMKIEILDEDGHALERGPGELTCVSSFPSMPIAFWEDPERKRLIETYFTRFPGKWYHGDWVERTSNGGYVVHGRSDATLKINGVRIGTAEIYRPLETMSEIEESAVVERQRSGGSEMILFVKLQPGVALTESLRQRISQTLRERASAHHVPHLIIAVDDLPRNNVGKVMELAIRDVVHGQKPRSVHAIINPESLDAVRSVVNQTS